MSASVFDEFEAESAATAKAEIAREDAAWQALGPAGQAQALADREAARALEIERQERIARQHDEAFGPDDPDEESDDGEEVPE